MIATHILADSLRIQAEGIPRDAAIRSAWAWHTDRLTTAQRLTLADILGIRSIVC